MNKKTLIWLILSTGLIAMFGWLGVYGLQGEEPRRAYVSIEMMLGGDYIFPHMFGWMYYNKPPFFNWIMVGFFQIMGTMNEWAVRMPSTLSIILLALINWFLTRRYVGSKVALYSSLFMVTVVEVLFYGSIFSGEIDLLFSLVVYLQVITFFIYLQKDKYFLMFTISYFLAGISFMTKGLPAIPFQVLTIGVVLIFVKKFKLLFSWQHLAGIIIFAGIIGGYIALLATDNQEVQFIIRQFKEASQRTGLETKVNDTIIGSLVFPFKILMLFLPWSLFLVFLSRKKILHSIRHNPLILFSVIFIIVNIPLYWFTGDFKSRYIYPFIPFISIVLAYSAIEGIKHFPESKIWIDRFLMIFFIVTPMAMIAVFFVPILNESAMSVPFQVSLIAASSLLLFKFLKYKKQRILLTVLLMFVIRLGLNNTYIQTLKTELQASYYQLAISEMVEITKDEPVFMSGQAMVFESEYDLGPFYFEADSLKTAPYIAFQIPYYITLETGNLVIFEEKMTRDKFYIVPDRLIDTTDINPRFGIHDDFTKQRWVLVKKTK